MKKNRTFLEHSERDTVNWWLWGMGLLCAALWAVVIAAAFKFSPLLQRILR